MHECPECGIYCSCHGDIDDLGLGKVPPLCIHLMTHEEYKDSKHYQEEEED